MNLTLYQVDAFTSKPFSGNPAAVCITEIALDEKLMQQIAMENNLSETAFLYPEKNGYNLRWFTPAVEVELCGHATLASAHIIWEVNKFPHDKEISFYTQSGELNAAYTKDGIQLDFPSKEAEEVAAPDRLLEALGVNAVYIGKSKFDYLVELNSADEIRNCNPNFSELKKLQVRGIMITAKSDENRYDFISRFFAPGAGVDEDPVTGSAHCTLTPYWAKKMNKSVLRAYQASKRGGELLVRFNGERTNLIGNAVTMMKFELFL
ncbi:MAG: PhzF family phenazine biosynthesis protein [Calditrichaeota bacterium]|nr:MAG: PhzF family phenazine biosynthesis protein [Calditrichota bacterium]